LRAQQRLLPVIRDAQWFGTEAGPYLLRLELPLVLEEMVAALYGVVGPADMRSAEELCGSVVVTLLLEGLPALQERAAKISTDEQHGTIESPEFLVFCRRRVAALLACDRAAGLPPVRRITNLFRHRT
jgi:hypothetical protein